MSTVAAKSTSETTGKPVKKNWEFERQRASKKVRGKFFFYDIPGGVLEFNYHMYKGDPIQRYILRDKQIYELPLGVAEHLNQVGTPVHEFEKNEKGIPLMKITSFKQRCAFQPLDFMGADDFSKPNIYTAEFVTDVITK